MSTNEPEEWHLFQTPASDTPFVHVTGEPGKPYTRWQRFKWWVANLRNPFKREGSSYYYIPSKHDN